MLFKLLALLGAGKGGVVAAAAIVAGVSTVNVATTTEFQNGLQEIVAAVQTVTSPGMSGLAKLGLIHDPCAPKGQPVVVAQRNAADKLIRDAYQSSHRELTSLRGGRDVDHQKVNGIVGPAQEELRDVMRASLDAVAALTLGREGQMRFETSRPSATASASPDPSATPTASLSPSASPSPAPTCAPEASETPEPTETPEPSESPAPTGLAEPTVRGRAAVAARVTLDPALAAIVEAAKAEMKTIVDEATAAVSELEPVERGQPDGKGKPEERGRPSERPGGKPSTPPGRDR